MSQRISRPALGDALSWWSVSDDDSDTAAEATTGQYVPSVYTANFGTDDRPYTIALPNSVANGRSYGEQFPFTLRIISGAVMWGGGDGLVAELLRTTDTYHLLGVDTERNQAVFGDAGPALLHSRLRFGLELLDAPAVRVIRHALMSPEGGR